MKWLVAISMCSLTVLSVLPALAQSASLDLEAGIESGVSFELEASVDAGTMTSARGEGADDGHARAAGYSPSHPLSIGLRSGVWVQRSLAPGVGAHVRWRPLRWIGVEVSTDHFFEVGASGERRDHLVGADLFFSVIGDERFFIAPTLGATLDVRATRAELEEGESLQALFGGHAGLMGEIYVIDGLAGFASAKAGVLAGAAGEIALLEEAHVFGEVFVEPVGMVMLGASYWF